jgi:hypothetical protein
MPSRTRHKSPARLRSCRRRRRARCWTVPAPSFPSRQAPPNLPSRQTLPSSDFPFRSRPSSSSFPWQQAPAKHRRMSRRAKAPRRMWSGSRLALPARSRPGEFQFARPAHWECQAVTSCQAPEGARRSCALVHRQSCSPRAPPPSPSQSASSWIRPFYPGARGEPPAPTASSTRADSSCRMACNRDSCTRSRSHKNPARNAGRGSAVRVQAGRAPAQSGDPQHRE